MSANVIVTFLKSPTRKATAILVIISLIIYLKRRLQSKLYIPSLQVLSRLNSRLINHYAKFPKRQIQHSRNAYLRGSLHGKGKLEYGHSHYDRESKKLIFFAVLGDEICGHQGIVHGGMVAGT